MLIMAMMVSQRRRYGFGGQPMSFLWSPGSNRVDVGFLWVSQYQLYDCGINSKFMLWLLEQASVDLIALEVIQCRYDGLYYTRWIFCIMLYRLWKHYLSIFDIL